MRRLLVRLLVNAVGLYAAVQLVPGIEAGNSWSTFILVALILTVVNAIIRPLLAFLTGPLILLTLGLFMLVINALMLWLASAISISLGLSFAVGGFVPAFWGALVLSLVNLLATIVLGEDRRR